METAMDSNQQKPSRISTDRCESVSQRKSAEHFDSPSIRRRWQEPSLQRVLFQFTAVYFMSVNLFRGGNEFFRYIPNIQHAYAFVVAQHSFRRKLTGTMQAKAPSTQSISLSSVQVTPELRTGPVTRKDITELIQQAEYGVGINHDDVGIPRSSTNNAKSTRRWFLTAAGTATCFVGTTSKLSPFKFVASAASIDLLSNQTLAARAFEYTEENQTAITVPLAYTGQELLISYKVDGSVFKAVLDTGSPFLMIPGSCGRNTRQKSGCYQNQGIPVLAPTIEIFDGFEGEVNWRSASFEFWDVNTNESVGSAATSTIATTQQLPIQPQKALSTQTAKADKAANKKEVIFGVASEAIMGGPGGVFFGMIRDTDARIRPSFLGQTDVRAFRINLSTRPRTLSLSSRDLIVCRDDTVCSTAASNRSTETVDYIPLTNVLRRRYGDPVGHYTACATSIFVNGYPLIDTTIEKKSKIFVIFDTGVTGMLVSRGLFDDQYILARKRKEKTLFGDVEINFSSALGKQRTLRAYKPLATPFDPEKTWKKFPKQRQGKRNSVHIIVMGLAFLEGHSLTVDIDGERILVE